MSANAAISFKSKETPRFEPSQLARIDLDKVPKHIAIIPDGNRRWAKRRLYPVENGHKQGADILMEVVKDATEIGIEQITFYGFSTENWNRPDDEVNALMFIYHLYLINNYQEMIDWGIRLHTIGDLSSLPDFLQETFQKTKEATKDCNTIDLILAMNYGSRDEMCRAIRLMAKDCSKGLIDCEQIDEKLISQYLDTCLWKDPELLIRTSGELRVSNFLLWQISYSEIHVSKVLWPDFRSDHLIEAIEDFQKRDRRWGGA